MAAAVPRMTLLAAAAPLVLVIVLLASGRFGALAAGAAGLAATVIAALGLHGTGGFAGFAVDQTLVGSWLSWQVISIVAGGVFFYRCIAARAQPTPPSQTMAAAPDHRRLYFVCFLLGPFAEAVTGFGVGYIIALAAVSRLGIGGVPALLFGLYSQSMVPWGALAAGTTVGGLLAGLSPTTLGALCGLLQMPVHLGYLALFWYFRRGIGPAPTAAQRLDDLVWTIAIVGTVWASHLVIDVEIAGAAPLGVLAALRWLRDERPDAAALRRAASGAAPYAALTIALVLTRTVAPLQTMLKSLWAWQPIAGQPSFPPFYAPGFWLLAVGLLSALALRAPISAVVGSTARAAWRPSVVTLLFVIMAAFYVAAGMAAIIADALSAAVGSAAALATPLFAAVGGFLTGSGAASNAMLMPMQGALAAETRLPLDWIAAVQNSVTANLTMLSPIRVSMGAAILALAGGDGAVYRRAWPLALPPLLVGVATILVLLTRS
ncbi:MAG: L-lactate permease [Alphaproteobacteria bacterium]|nr:L-lactate permease [Alphaproteobacteria bacterium]MCW5740992.1 L-lactate permease [Alphaproteobacteria bacterium]